MPPKDKKLVNFSENHELNNRLRKNQKRQTEENREKLKELGDLTKEKLSKSRLTHSELDAAIESKIENFD